jgi:hypothetical protein
MKKDPNYIAAVEKAIAEKYGKETVQDFRNDWDERREAEYLEQLKEKNKKTTKNKRQKPEHLERNCPVCKTYSFSVQDDLYMNRFKCCRMCYIEYIAPSPAHEKKWQSGWRPDDTEVERRMSIRRQK